MKLPRLLKISTSLTLATAGLTTLPLAAQSQPLPGVQGQVNRAILDQYIVTFRDDADVDASAAALTREHGARVLRVYRTALKGVTISVPAAAVQGILNRPGVMAVEQDQTVSVRQALTTQSNATFGIDRINQRALPLDGLYTYAGNGAGVRVYVIDTGVLGSHTEFTGRMLPGFTAISDGVGTSDCDGHGTHVAATAAGTVYGVAKGASVVPVRVLDCAGSGSSSGVIAGVDWVAANAPANSVANMSLGGGASTALDTAVANLVSRGVVTVVAAGNSNANACNYSPARAPTAITVGATTTTDARASYSNFGTCLDIFAPGSGIVSAGIASNTATATLSGTSMASPHVAGVAALIRAASPGLSPAGVDAEIKRRATAGRVTSAGTGSTTSLLYSLDAQSVNTAVASLSATTRRTIKGRQDTWTASVRVGLYDTSGSGTPVANATVTGRYTAGSTTSTQSCVTGSTGSCTMPTVTYNSATVTSVTFTVTNVGGANLVYNAPANQATSLTILRP